MITSLQLVDFKNFNQQTLRVGPFTLIVGTNASGKSNIRDAFRVLHGIGRGYTLAELIGGKYGTGGQVEWGPIRGAPNEIGRLQQKEDGKRFALEVKLSSEMIFRYGGRTVTRSWPFRYLIKVENDIDNFGNFKVIREELHRSMYNEIYTSHPSGSDPVCLQEDESHLQLRMEKGGDQRRYGDRISVRFTQPALTQIREHRRVRRGHKDAADAVINILKIMRFLDLAPDRMRQPAFPGQNILGDGGENLPTVLRDICSDTDRKKNLIDWTRELTPMDVVDFDFPVDPVTGLVQLVIRETDETKLSSYSVSDGTLRFLAMLAALLDRSMKGLYFFEEIDSGIHPSRLQLLVDLIERQTERQDLQVIATTHSPELLSIISDETFRNTSVVCRQEGTSDAIIRPVSEIPGADKLRQSQGLGKLLATGWMETALAFTEGDEDEEGPLG